MNYGGKANSLLKLKENNFNVPDFFVISSDEYIDFLRYNAIIQDIETLAKNKKYDEIKARVLNGKFSNELKESIEDKLSKLKTSQVSVRSSASNEDGIKKSFAGQYESFLNVTRDNIFECIKKCWCSLYNSNILEYEEKPNIYGMNVIIQKMIQAEYAGVAFSIDATSDTKNYSVIEIVKGLGENLVSGKVTPSRCLVRRQTRKVDLLIGEKLLDEETISSLEKIILEIERIYNLPVDVEYGVIKNEIFILQARPISKFTVNVKPYSLSITRPHTIIEEEIYYRGEYEGIKKLTGGLYYFKPLFVYDSKLKNVGIYYNDIDLEEDPRLMYRVLDEKYDELTVYMKEIEENIKYIENIMNKSLDVDIDKFEEIFEKVYPFSSLGQLAGHFEDITERLKNLLFKYREYYDNFIHDACEYMQDKIKEKLMPEYREFLSVITLEEIKSGKLPEIDELNERLKGYIYFGKVYNKIEYDNFFIKHNIKLMVDEIKECNEDELSRTNCFFKRRIW